MGIFIYFKQLRSRFQATAKRTILKTIIATMRVVGCTLKSTNGYTICLTNIATAIFVFVTSLEAIALVLAKEPARRFECFSVLSFCGMAMLKLFSLRIYKKRWIYLLKQIDTLEKQQTDNEEYESDEENNGKFDIHIHEYTESFEGISGLVLKMYGLTAVIYILFPFLEYTFLKSYMDTHKGYPHILPITTPLDFNILGYVVTILIELIAAIFSVCVHVAFDLLAIGLMIFCRGQLRVLRHCSENIAGIGRLCDIRPDGDIRGIYRIKMCHRLHIFLVNFIKELGRALKYILGIYYLVASFTLCTVAVRLNTEVLTTMELVRLVQYLCGTLTQLFLLCYYGNTIVCECSMGMGEGPAGCAYWRLSPHVRRELILLTIGMSLQLKLQAGPFHTLDLPSFIMILRAAYSYYAILRK